MTLTKMTKEQTQQEVKALLRKYSKVNTKQENADTVQQDKTRIKKALVFESLHLIIESAFRGNEEDRSTAFDITTDLMQELTPFYHKSIGEARRKQAADLIADYFTPEAVNGYKIKCYISFEEYYKHIHFYITYNGFTHGTSGDICDIHFNNTSSEQPFNLVDGYTVNWSGERRTVKTTYRHDGIYTAAADINKMATRVYNDQKKTAAKVKKLIAAVNDEIEQSRARSPYRVQYFNKIVYISDLCKNNHYNSI